MKYRRLVGRLIYLTITRPDLVYTLHILSQFVQAPREEHMDAARWVLRYLKKKTAGFGILLKFDNDMKLFGFCDFNWGHVHFQDGP